MKSTKLEYLLLLSLFCFLFYACENEKSKKSEQQTEEKKTLEENKIQTIAAAEKEIMEDIDLDYIMGKFDPSQHKDFISIEAKYADRSDRILHKETYAAFLKMHAAAKQDGIDLKIISATRNFANQKRIWESKWTGARLVEEGENLAKTTPNPKERALKILKWSSMPGSSRHHWGSDIDLNDLVNSYFESGEGLKVYTWLLEHASTYGFCQPYTAKDAQRPNGYNEEKWHWSYLPIAKKLTDQAAKHLRNDMIKGFKGAETATEINILDNFILGINQDCL